MRSANFVAVVRRRRATIILAAVRAALVAAATAFGATAALPPYKLVLNYQAYVGGKGKANPNLAPVKIGYINGQGGPVNFNFPQATSVIRAGVKMVNAELGGVNGHPVQAQRVLLGPGGGGRHPLRPADGQRQGEDDHLRLRHGPQPGDLRDGQGHDPGHRRHHLQPGRHDREERVLPERQPDDRHRRLWHLHASASTRTSRPRPSSIRPIRARSRPRPLSGRACSRWE